ncbi:hypothetical protein WA158_006263 [Blastocystis sp. Blastoise]
MSSINELKLENEDLKQRIEDLEMSLLVANTENSSAKHNDLSIEEGFEDSIKKHLIREKDVISKNDQKSTSLSHKKRQYIYDLNTFIQIENIMVNISLQKEDYITLFTYIYKYIFNEGIIYIYLLSVLTSHCPQLTSFLYSNLNNTLKDTQPNHWKSSQIKNLKTYYKSLSISASSSLYTNNKGISPTDNNNNNVNNNYNNNTATSIHIKQNDIDTDIDIDISKNDIHIIQEQEPSSPTSSISSKKSFSHGDRVESIHENSSVTSKDSNSMIIEEPDSLKRSIGSTIDSHVTSPMTDIDILSKYMEICMMYLNSDSEKIYIYITLSILNTLLTSTPPSIENDSYLLYYAPIYKKLMDLFPLFLPAKQITRNPQDYYLCHQLLRLISRLIELNIFHFLDSIYIINNYITITNSIRSKYHPVSPSTVSIYISSLSICNHIYNYFLTNSTLDRKVRLEFSKRFFNMTTFNYLTEILRNCMNIYGENVYFQEVDQIIDDTYNKQVASLLVNTYFDITTRRD